MVQSTPDYKKGSCVTRDFRLTHPPPLPKALGPHLGSLKYFNIGTWFNFAELFDF